MIKNKLSIGFTIVELMVSMGILAVIFAISTINLSTIIPNTSQSTSFDTLLNDIKAQQTKAMSGNTSFGVHFESDKYTLFQGDTYVSGNSSNFDMAMDPTVRITNINFPGAQIVFLAGSGDISGFVAGNDNFSLSNTQTNLVTTIRINKYGATY